MSNILALIDTQDPWLLIDMANYEDCVNAPHEPDLLKRFQRFLIATIAAIEELEADDAQAL